VKCDHKKIRRSHHIIISCKHPPFSRPFRHCPVSAQVNHCTSFVRGLRPHLWRGGNISFGHLECQGGSERSGSVCRRSHVIWCKHTPPFSRPFRHCPVSAQVNHCTSFVRGLRPHLWRGGNISFGHLECQGGSERSGSVCRRSHVIWCKHPPILSPLSSLPCLRPSESLHLVCARPSPTSMARREHQLWASGVPGWVGTVRFCVQEESCNMMVQTHPPILSPLSSLPCLRPSESLHLVCARPSPTSMARREHQLWASGVPGWVGTVRFCVQEESCNMVQTHTPILSPLSSLPCLRPSESLHLVCARPSPTSMARREHQLWASGVPGWVGTVRFCVQEESCNMVQTPHPILSPLSSLPCLRPSESLHLVCARPSPTSMARREHQLWASGVPGWVGTVRFCVQEESCNMVQTHTPILSPLASLPCLRPSESLHLVCARPSPTSMAMREHQLWASGVPGWVGTVRFCVQEESCIWCKHPPPFSRPFRHCPVSAQVNHCTSFVRGLRPHLWRCGNISFGHLECQGGSERSGSVCRRSHVIWCKHHPILSPLSTLPCLRPSESLHLVCARPSPTSMARREHQLWASGVPGWVGTVRFCVQEESCNMVQTPPPFSRPFRHCPVSAQVNHCTSFVRGLRPHLWRGGNISFGHLECQGGSERSGSVCRRSHVIWCKHPPFSRPFRHCPVSAQVNHCTSFVRGLRPHLWRGGNISFGHLECQGGSERSGSVCRRSHVIWCKHTPFSRPFRHCPVSAQVNHCTSFVRGLRPHLWRGGNISFGHLECQGGSERSGSVCRRSHVIWCKHTPHSLAPFVTALSPPK
jgi:hypothetical protein